MKVGGDGQSERALDVSESVLDLRERRNREGESRERQASNAWSQQHPCGGPGDA